MFCTKSCGDKKRKVAGVGWGSMAVLDRAVKEGLPEEGASKKASGTEGTSHAYIQGKCIPGRGNSHCKGHKAEACLGISRNRKGAGVTRAD